MRSYRIVLEYTDHTNDDEYGHPETWNWWTLLDIGIEEAVSVVSVEDIPTPEGHKEDLQNV